MLEEEGCGDVGWVVAAAVSGWTRAWMFEGKGYRVRVREGSSRSRVGADSGPKGFSGGVREMA